MLISTKEASLKRAVMQSRIGVFKPVRSTFAILSALFSYLEEGRFVRPCGEHQDVRNELRDRGRVRDGVRTVLQRNGRGSLYEASENCRVAVRNTAQQRPEVVPDAAQRARKDAGLQSTWNVSWPAGDEHVLFRHWARQVGGVGGISGRLVAGLFPGLWRPRIQDT